MTRVNENQHKAPVCCSSRYGLALLGLYGLFVVYTLRISLSVALVDMLNSTHQSSTNHSSSVCPGHTNHSQPIRNHRANVYDWDSETQGWILSAFFYGYITTQILGGHLATHFGPKWVMGCGILASAVFTLLTPVAADMGAGFLIAVRVHSSAWVLKFLLGAQLGTIVALPLSAEICFYLGWTYVFYVFGNTPVVSLVERTSVVTVLPTQPCGVCLKGQSTF